MSTGLYLVSSSTLGISYRPRRHIAKHVIFTASPASAPLIPAPDPIVNEPGSGRAVFYIIVT
jgi:hypothetical protein